MMRTTGIIENTHTYIEKKYYEDLNDHDYNKNCKSILIECFQNIIQAYMIP